MIMSHIELLRPPHKKESLAGRKDLHIDFPALLWWDKIHFEQVYGQNTFTLHKESTWFKNDPICNDCGDVPFRVEGEWHRNTSHIYLDNV